MDIRDFFEPPWEQTHIVVIGTETVRLAERRIKSCEACTPDVAEIPFDWLLDRITARDPRVTEYMLEQSAQCPRCRCAVSEKTLVALEDDDDFGGA
jgi:hypothetical protein